MTASRTCRACGAELHGDVMWCLRCFAPIRALSPRKPQLPAVSFVADREEAERSRWKAGVNTFGPGGRVAITLLVLILAPWTTNLVVLVVVWPCYLILAGMVLRSTWRKGDVQTTTLAAIVARGRPAAEPPAPVATPVPRSTFVAWAAFGGVVLAVAIGWAMVGQVGHAVVGICGSLAGLILAVRWLARP